MKAGTKNRVFLPRVEGFADYFIEQIGYTNTFLEKIDILIKKKEVKPLKPNPSILLKLGDRDLNPNSRSQSPLSCR